MSNDPIQEYLDKQSQDQTDTIAQYAMKQNNNQVTPKNEKKSFLQKSADFVEPFNNFIQNTRLPEASGGLIQGAYNTGKSILDLAPQLVGSNARLPEGNLDQYTKQDPLSRMIFQGSELASEIGSGIGAYGQAGKALGMGPESGIAKRIAQGASTGYATGEESPGGRGLSAAIGGGLAGAGQLTNNALASKAFSVMNKHKSESLRQFNNALSSVPENYGVIPEGQFNFKNIKKAFSGEKTEEIDKYLENPNVQNAHFAQSSLGKKISELNKQKLKEGSAFNKNGQLNKLIESQNALQKGLEKTLNLFDPESLKNYLGAKEGFEKNVVPYLGKGLEEYGKNRKWASESVRNLTKSRPFMEGEFKGTNNQRFIPGKSSEISGLKTRQALNKVFGNHLVKYYAPGLLGVYGTEEFIRR